MRMSADALAYAASRPVGGVDPFGLIDLTTGAFNSIAQLNVFVNDLVVSSNGTIYVLTSPLRGSGSEQFGTINPATGVITNIAVETDGLSSLDFSSDGTLYSNAVPAGGGAEKLYTINPLTGTTSFVATLSGAAASTADQIRFIGNTLYTTSFVTPSSLYSIDRTTGAETLIGNTGLLADNGLGSVLNGQLVDIEKTSTGGQMFTIDPGSGVATAGTTIDNFYVFSLSKEVGLNLQGGTSSNPVFLFSAQPVGQVTGAIGGAVSQDYYSFFWSGGDFSASASITGAIAGTSYSFSEGLPGGCGNGASATLNSADSFTGTIAVANLNPGQYCIGLTTDESNDPGYTIVFNTALPAQTPEPRTLLLVGLGVVAAFARVRKPKNI